MSVPAPQITSGLPQPEYTIYTFMKQQGRRGADAWLAMGRTSDIEQARARAKALFQSARYSRIELRKRYVSEKTGTAIDIPLETYGPSQNRDLRQTLIFLGLAFGCALTAIVLSLAL